MQLTERIIVYTSMLLFFFSAQGYADSIIYYNSDHSEVSAESYQETAKTYQKKYQEAKKAWGTVKPNLIRECIALSGMDQFIKSFPENIDTMFEQGTLSSGQAELDNKAIRIIKDSFDPQPARKKLVWYCKKHMNQQILRDVMPWLRSTVSRKITQAENDMLTPEGQAGLLVYASNLQNSQPSQDRVVLMEEFIEASDLIDSSMKVAIKVFEGITNSMNLAFPEDKRIDQSRIRSLVERIRPTLEKQLEQNLRLSVYYIYRDILNAELAAYIAFLETESGARFNQIGTDAISNVLVDYFSEVGEKLISSIHT